MAVVAPVLGTAMVAVPRPTRGPVASVPARGRVDPGAGAVIMTGTTAPGLLVGPARGRDGGLGVAAAKAATLAPFVGALRFRVLTPRGERERADRSEPVASESDFSRRFELELELARSSAAGDVAAGGLVLPLEGGLEPAAARPRAAAGAAPAP